jgi:hypothetical protein
MQTPAYACAVGMHVATTPQFVRCKVARQPSRCECERKRKCVNECRCHAQELNAVARRAPGSIDTRAAVAALQWAAGNEERAEAQWSWACSKINSGQLVPGGPVLDSCTLYADADWLGRIRRWPPVMVWFRSPLHSPAGWSSSGTNNAN